MDDLLDYYNIFSKEELSRLIKFETADLVPSRFIFFHPIVSMDEWRIQQQTHRMISGGVGPVLNYHSIRSRSSPYPTTHQMSDLKQSYQYSSNPPTASSNPLSPVPMSATTPNPMSSTTPIPTQNDPNETITPSSDEVSTTTSNSVSLQISCFHESYYPLIFAL